MEKIINTEDLEVNNSSCETFTNTGYCKKCSYRNIDYNKKIYSSMIILLIG